MICQAKTLFAGVAFAARSGAPTLAAPDPDPPPAADGDGCGVANVRIVAFGPEVDVSATYELGAEGLLIGKRGCHLDLPRAAIPDRAIRLRAQVSGLALEAVGDFRIPLENISVAEGWIAEGKSLTLRLEPYEIFLEPSRGEGTRLAALAEPGEEPASGRGAEWLDETVFGATPRDAGPPREEVPVLNQLEIQWTVVEGEGAPAPVSKSPFVIGRTSGDLMVPDRSVSAKHAQLEILDADHFLLKDLASTNGTAVNGRLISATRLRNGDVVSFGNARYRFLVRSR